MIWLILPLALGLGFVAARTIFDMQKAHADAAIASQATTMHLEGAQAAPTPHEAAAHVTAAATANQVAAIKVAEAAANSKTTREKQIAVLMAELTELNRLNIMLTAQAITLGVKDSDSMLDVAHNMAAYNQEKADIVRQRDSIRDRRLQIEAALGALGVRF